MWNISSGGSTLSGFERQLFRELVDGLVDEIDIRHDTEEPYSVGVQLFDSLQPSQQMAMLHHVASALLLADYPEPELTAVNEATVYALFRHLFMWIEIEIDMQQISNNLDHDDNPYEFRAKVLASYEHSMSDEVLEELRAEGFVPALGCSDATAWKPIVEALADRILWDRDFEMEYLTADSAPENADLLKAHMGIEEGYYTAIAPELSVDAFERTRDTIRQLVRD